MRGARIAVTLPMRVIPPRITTATADAASSPVTTLGVPKFDSSVSARVFACTALPVMNAVKPRATAKNTAIHRQRSPRPRSM